MTLSALGLIGGEKVMLEKKNPQGNWPRRRYIEDPGFRNFRENDRVDAMDYQGRWFRGQVEIYVPACSLLPILDSSGALSYGGVLGLSWLPRTVSLVSCDDRTPIC